MEYNKIQYKRDKEQILLKRPNTYFIYIYAKINVLASLSSNFCTIYRDKIRYTKDGHKYFIY